MILARVVKCAASYRSLYQFWDGNKYVSDWAYAVPLFKDVPQGAIVRSELFGKEKPWVLVGVSKWADSKVRIGAASKLEGPWDIVPTWEVTGIEKDDSYKYCIYPHDWAQVARDELMVTWSEQWPGGVIAAKLRFALRYVFSDLPLSDLHLSHDYETPFASVHSFDSLSSISHDLKTKFLLSRKQD